MLWFRIVCLKIICFDAGVDRIRINGQPSTGVAEPREAIVVVGPYHQQAWNGSRPDDGCVGGCRGQKRRLCTPPWRERRGYQLDTGACAER